jgi:hypothetical protein
VCFLSLLHLTQPFPPQKFVLLYIFYPSIAFSSANLFWQSTQFMAFLSGQILHGNDIRADWAHTSPHIRGSYKIHNKTQTSTHSWSQLTAHIHLLQYVYCYREGCWIMERIRIRTRKFEKDRTCPPPPRLKNERLPPTKFLISVLVKGLNWVWKVYLSAFNYILCMAKTKFLVHIFFCFA